MKLVDLKNKKIAIVGLGINNRHLAEYFKKNDIKFEIVDGWKTPDDLVGKLDNFEIIFRTPGLPYLSKAIQQAKQKGVVIYSQTKLFFDLCPCPIIGITGTKGKGTTATLIDLILRAAGKNTWLGGNIGNDPFEFIDRVKMGDWVVLELSSFQLQDVHKSPHIAVVLKITPEHLDHHNSV
jgi:UDP-N-acetylmuramoylalanine--D-glutamate ligase